MTDQTNDQNDDELLELSSLVPKRRRARLRTEKDPDGTIYELAVASDFGARTLQQLFHEISEMDDLWGNPKISKAEEKRLDVLLNTLAARLIVGIPDADVAEIPAIDKRALVMRFFVEIGGRVSRTMGPETAAIMRGASA